MNGDNVPHIHLLNLNKEKVVTKDEYTSNDCNFCKSLKRQLFIASCLNIGHLVIGYSICWSAPILQKLLDPEMTPLDKPLQESQIMWVGGIANVGVIFGTQFGAVLSNILGRKPTLLLFALIMVTGHVILLYAKNFWTLVAGRVVNGLGVGGTACGNLVYIGEIAPTKYRGMILSSTGVTHALGSLLVFSVAPYVSYSIVHYVVLVLGSLHVLGLIFIPESPVYHVIKGNNDAAKTTLFQLGRSNDVDKELKIMINDVKDKKLQYTQLRKEGRILPRWIWLNIFRTRNNRRALLITTVLFIIQEGSGITCILFFATTIFQKAASSVNPDIATIVLGVTQVLGTLLAPIMVERYGKRTLLLLSTSGCALCTAVLGANFWLELLDHPVYSSIRWIPLATLVTFLFCFNAGLSIIPNVLVGEMFSPGLRSAGCSIAMCHGFLAGLLASLCFGYIMIHVGSHFVFILFAIIDTFGCFFTFKFVPETKGKTLMEVDAMLAALP